MSLVITVVVVLPWLLSAATMRISTYNLRFDSQPDNITVQESLDALPDPLVQPSFLQFTREQPWSTRRMRVVEHLLGEGVVIAGFQEALVRQVNDLAQLFGDDYAWIGVGRDDGVAAGEFSPIFYSKEAVKLLSNDSFWLSNTPFEPSKFPGAGSFRVCTVARFQIIGPIDGRQMFTLLNTHLDDQSDDQRRLAASLLLTRARFEAVKTEAPVFITGDFNSPSTGQDSGAYGIITGTIPPVPINATFADKFAVKDDELPDFKMLDLREETPRRSVSANFATCGGNKLEFAGMVLGAVSVAKGVSAVIGPIISGLLLEAGRGSAMSGRFGRFGYGAVEIFVGSCAFAAGIASVVVAFARQRILS